MLTLVGLGALVLVVGGSLWLVMGRIHQRARAAGVSPFGAQVLAFLGYMVGTVASNAGAFCLLDVAYSSGDPPGPLIFLAMLVGSCVGAVVGAGFGYVFLWARTARDPDYGPLDPPTDVDPAARPEG
jgi:hypothetical protein